MSNNIVIFGYSGHAHVVIDSAIFAGLKITGYFDIKQATENPYELNYLGCEEAIDPTSLPYDFVFFPAIGSNSTRARICLFIEENNLQTINIVHPSSIISSKVRLGNLIFVGPGTIINSGVVIGKGSIINTGAIVEHDCEISELCHIAPGAVLAGNVKVGSRSFIGANSVVKEGQKIGKNAIIGAGSVVINDIPDDETWAGNPAKRIK